MTATSGRGQGGRALLKVLLAVFGLGLSVVLLSTAFFKWNLQGAGPLLQPRFPLGEFVRDLPGHLVWLLPFFLLQASVIPLRAVQWQSTLRRPVPLKERYHLVAIGAFVHNALPGKLGDVMRSFLLSRTQRIPFLRCLGSVGVCKLMEFAALMLLVSVSLLGPFGATLSRFEGELKVAVSLCVGLVALVVLLAHWAAPLAHWLHRRHKLPRLEGFLHHVSEGLGTARSFIGMARVFAFSVGPVLASALAYGMALHGIGISGGLFAGAVVLGATPEDAAAFTTLTHLGTVISQVGVGAVSVHLRKIRIRDLRKGGSLAREAAQHVAHDAVEPAPP